MFQEEFVKSFLNDVKLQINYSRCEMNIHLPGFLNISLKLKWSMALDNRRTCFTLYMIGHINRGRSPILFENK